LALHFLFRNSCLPHLQTSLNDLDMIHGLYDHSFDSSHSWSNSSPQNNWNADSH
jgi:hypothetical protein